MAVLLIDVAFMLGGAPSATRSRESTYWIVMCLVGMSMFIMDLFALSWVAMWSGLTTTRTNRASSGAISKILILPWIVFLLSMTVFGLIAILGRVRFGPVGSMVYWFVLSAVNNLIFIAWSKSRLHRDFRHVALQRLVPGGSGWWHRAGLWWGRKAASRKTDASRDIPPLLSP